MNCYYHLDRESVATCTECGRGLCNQCANDLSGKHLCYFCERDIEKNNIKIYTKRLAISAIMSIVAFCAALSSGLNFLWGLFYILIFCGTPYAYNYLRTKFASVIFCGILSLVVGVAFIPRLIKEIVGLIENMKNLKIIEATISSIQDNVKNLGV